MTQMWRMKDSIGAQVPETGSIDFGVNVSPFRHVEAGHDAGRALPSGWWLLPMLGVSLGFWVWLAWTLFG